MLPIAGVVLAVFAYGVVAAILGTLLPSYSFSGAESGVIALAQSAGLLLASAAAGPWIDHLGNGHRGAKLPLIAGLGGMAAVLWVLPFASSLASITAVLFFLAGIGGGVTSIAVNSMASDIGAERRAALLSFTNVFYGLGLIVTPWASTLLGNDARRLCMMAAALATATFAVHVIYREPSHAAAAAAAGANSSGGFNLDEARRMLANPLLWLLGISQFFYVATEVGISNWMPSYLIQKGISKNDALSIMAWRFGLGLLLGRVAAAPVLLRVGALRMLMAASAAVSATTLWILKAGDASTVGWAVFCAGLALAPVFPSAMGLTGGLFPRSMSTAMSMVVTFGWMGLLSSSPAIGAVAGADKAHLGTALLAFPVFGLLMLAAQLTLAVTRKRQDASR